MDVVCGRCRAEYEFDDALISERGTTVRCTNCGLQFKIFPPVGQRAPEVWTVFDPRDQRVEPARYDSLREMQKDIARGVVTAEHLLARGDEPPRPLKEIVELQPLLHQPKSEPPPAPDSAPAAAVPSVVGMKTVLGVAQRPDPSAAAAAPSPPRPPADLSGDLDEHAVVPGDAFERHSPIPFPKDGEVKPRIRSALSMSLSTAGVKSRAHQDSDDREGRSSLAPPRQSLRSTLVSAPVSQRPSPVPSEKSPPSSRRQAPQSERGGRPSSEVEVAPSNEGAVALPPVEENAPPSEKPAASAPGRATPAAVTAPVEPKIFESGEYAGQMTPTPSGMRAYRSSDAEPASSVAGVHVKQRARTGGIILAVLVGGGAFLGFAYRDKLTGVVNEAQPEGATSETAAREVPQDLALRLQMADAAWLSGALLQNPSSDFKAPNEKEIQKLESELAALGVVNSWEKVNLLRVAGRLGEAREAAGSLEKGSEQPYALALLDLAEEKDNPPWPVVIERLREASSGERGRFLARSAYIYSLATSGALPRAVADFEALGQLAGGKDAPLYEELRIYLERLNAFDGETDGSEETAPPAEESLPSGETPASDEEDVADVQAPEPPVEPVEAKPTEEQATAPQTKKVSEAMKAKVAQADAMWRGGNQEGALAIYRQVVAEVGTKNFLGQRSASRIAQAARERAAGE